MKNTCTTLQVVLLSVLLFHAPQTLQERIERNAEEIPDADVLEDGRKSVGVRKMLSTKDASSNRGFLSLNVLPRLSQKKHSFPKMKTQNSSPFRTQRRLRHLMWKARQLQSKLKHWC